MEQERLAQFIIKVFALTFAVFALEQLWYFTMSAWDFYSDEHGPVHQNTHRHWASIMIELHTETLRFILFNLVVACVVWFKSKCISQFILKRIK